MAVRFLFALVVAGVILAGCGSGDSGSSPATTTGSSATSDAKKPSDADTTTDSSKADRGAGDMPGGGPNGGK